MIRSSIVLVVMAAIAGCGASDPQLVTDTQANTSAQKGFIDVVATVGMVGDIVRNVGGDHVAITQICGSGVDPHLYKATRDDMQSLMQADIVFYCGLMLEGRMSDTLIKMAHKKPIVAVTEGIDETVLLQPEDFAGHYDPHVWMDVLAWSRCVDVVSDALAQIAPAHKADFKTNADSYKQELTKLHEYGRKSLASVPPEKRLLITSHDAFNYFGRAYGLEVVGIQGLSTESEAGLQRINELVDLLVAKQVHAVFVESSVSPKNVQSLVEGARANGHDVIIGGELFSDAMGETGTYEGTYIGMLDHNITLVTRGLGGEAPELGMQNKLTKK